MNNQRGFTLIELILVIVILGIMSSIVAPKFINLQSDARASVMKGVQGAVSSAAGMIHAKSLIAGVEGMAAGTVNIASIGAVNTVYGYPAADDALDIIDLVDLSLETNVTGVSGVFTYAGTTACTITYAEPTGAGLAPLITNDLSAC